MWYFDVCLDRFRKEESLFLLTGLIQITQCGFFKDPQTTAVCQGTDIQAQFGDTSETHAVDLNAA